MRLTYEQQCQRADDAHSEGQVFCNGQWLTPDEVASLPKDVNEVCREPVATAIKLMPRDDSHLREIARDVGRMFRGARS